MSHHTGRREGRALGEPENEDVKRRERAQRADALAVAARQPGERSKLGTRVAGAVAVLALVAGGTLGVGAWNSYKAEKDKKAAEEKKEQAAATSDPSPSASSGSPSEDKDDKPAEKPTSPSEKEPEQPPEKSEEPKETPAKKERLARTHKDAHSKKLLANQTTGMCADIPGFGRGTLGDAPVNQFPCNGSEKDNQLWNINVVHPGKGPKGSSLVHIVNAKDGYCMDLPGSGGHSPGTKVWQAQCNGNLDDNQLWWVNTTSYGTVLIHNLASNNHCLRVNGDAPKKKDVQLTIGDCVKSKDTDWRLR